MLALLAFNAQKIYGSRDPPGYDSFSNGVLPFRPIG